MELQKRHAWLLFSLAFVCVLSAVGLAVWSNRPRETPAPTQPQFEQPRSVPRVVYKAPIPPAAPAAVAAPAAATKATPAVPKTVRMVQVYPGGWVWNPALQDGPYWDRWDRRPWEYERTRHWDPAWDPDFGPRICPDGSNGSGGLGCGGQ